MTKKAPLKLNDIRLWWADVHSYKKIEKMTNWRLEEVNDDKVFLWLLEQQFNDNFKKIEDYINDLIH
jgi:hypothetical protein